MPGWDHPGSTRMPLSPRGWRRRPRGAWAQHLPCVLQVVSVTHLSMAAYFRFKLALKCWDEATQLWRSRAQGREHSPDPGACLLHGVSWGEAAPLTEVPWRWTGALCTPGLEASPFLSCLTRQSQKNDVTEDQSPPKASRNLRVPGEAGGASRRPLALLRQHVAVRSRASHGGKSRKPVSARCGH